jgi:hypothetical protein
MSPSLKEKHAARAVELLRFAVTGGFRDQDKLKSNKNLDSLRKRDDFQRLLRDLETKTAPK